MPIKRNIPEDDFFGQDEDPFLCVDDIYCSSEEEPQSKDEVMEEFLVQ